MEVDLLDNAYTNRDFEYLKSKSLDVCIIVRNRATNKVSMKSTLPMGEVQKILFKECGNAPDERWISQSQRGKFPKSPGPLGDILGNRAKLQQFSSNVMTFWKGVRGRQAMGVGKFEAWDTYELDMGQVSLLVDQFDKIRGSLNTFMIKMRDVIEWEDLAGIHGIQTGNLKKVKVDWTWLEVLKLIIIWSYAVAGVSIEDNVDQTWSPNADDFEDKKKKQFKVGRVKKKTTSKKKCTPAQKEAGRKQGIERARAYLFKPTQSDYELAMALSVSEEVEKERESKKDEEHTEIAKALSLSMNEMRDENNLPAER